MAGFGPAVTAPANAEAAAWIDDRLGRFGTVGGLVPSGFDRYLLVHRDRRTSALEDIGVMSGLAAGHTTTPDRVWYAIWDGYGWGGASTVHYATTRPNRWRRRAARRQSLNELQRIERALCHVPAIVLPHRRYYLLAGPLEAATELLQPETTTPLRPDLCWPEDHRWFIATDTDLAWTYIGGDIALIEELRSAFPARHEVVTRDQRNSTFAPHAE
jgi:hypothetical protein